MDITVAANVKDFCAQQGITIPELHDMVNSAAIHSQYEGFNRKYQDWLFRVYKGHVMDMQKVEDAPKQVVVAYKEIGFDRGEGFVIEECEECGGAGCNYCRHEGEVKRWL